MSTRPFDSNSSAVSSMHAGPSDDNLLRNQDCDAYDEQPHLQGYPLVPNPSLDYPMQPPELRSDPFSIDAIVSSYSPMNTSQGTNPVLHQSLVDGYQHPFGHPTMPPSHPSLIPPGHLDVPLPYVDSSVHLVQPYYYPSFQYFIDHPVTVRPCICGCLREAVPLQSCRRGGTSDIYHPRDLIFFRTVEGHCGINVADALEEKFDTLYERDKFPFDQSRSSKAITVCLGWPGYKRSDHRVRTLDWSQFSRPTRLSKLAFMIARILATFINENQGEPDTGEDPRWRVGPNGIKAEDLVLVALEQVSKGSWEPHLCLVQRRTSDMCS